LRCNREFKHLQLKYGSVRKHQIRFKTEPKSIAKATLEEITCESALDESVEVLGGVPPHKT